MKKILLTAFLLTGVAYAAPTTQSVEELTKYAPYETLFYSQIAEPLEMERMALAAGMSQDKSISEEDRKKALKIYDDYAEGLLKLVDNQKTKDSLKNSFIKAASANFTQGEVDAQVAFYGSKDGQSALKKQEKVFGEYLQDISNTHKKTLTDYQAKNLDKMRKDIEKIIDKDKSDNKAKK